MDPITHLSGALIDGGVTDGKRSVFYNDVVSVDLRKRSSMKMIALMGATWIFVIGGIWMVFDGFSEGSFKDIAVGIGVTALFGFGAYFASGSHETTVIVNTRRGRKKLIYEGYRSDLRDLGREVAEILNRRKGGGGELPTDMSHFVIELEGERPEFFRIDGDLLHLFRESVDGEDITCTIDLRKVARVEKRSRRSDLQKKRILFGEIVSGTTVYDVIFIEHSGQEALHFIWHIFDVPRAEGEEPAQILVRAVNGYFAANAGKADQSIA